MPAVWECIQVVPKVETGTVVPSPVPAINGVNPKFLVLLVPHVGEVSTEWALMLRKFPMMAGSNFSMSKGSPIDVTREMMANNVIKDGFEWAFFLDSDVIPPMDTLQKLLSHNQPIVAGLYKARKPEGFTWAAWIRGRNPEGRVAFAPVASWGDARTFECDVTGCGCMLIHRSVFIKIKERFPDFPLFFWASGRNPALLDKMGIPDEAMREVSEDFWFCCLAKLCGYKILIDTEVKCGHISVVKIEADRVGLPGA